MTKKQEYLILAGLLVLIFPFFALLLYVHPQGDDFFFAYKMQSQGIFDFVKEMYFTWSGRYFSMFLGAVDPWVYESLWGLRFSLIIYQLITIYSIYLLFSSFFKPGYSLLKIGIMSLVFYALFINSTLSVFELIFWYPAASSYQLSLAFITMFIAIQFYYHQKRLSKSLYILLSIIMLFITIGLLELAIAPLMIVLILSLLADIKNKSHLKVKLGIIIAAVVFALVMILAPGNYLRHSTIGSEVDMFHALVLALKTVVLALGFLFKSPTFILVSILVISFSYFFIKKKLHHMAFRIPIIKPWIIVLASLLIIISITFPATVILQHLPPARVLNMVLYFIMILWFFSIILIVNYYSTRFSFSVSKNIILILTVAALFSIYSGIGVLDKNAFAHGNYKTVYFNGNIIKAYYVLFFEAKDFDSVMNKRLELYKVTRKNGGKAIKVDGIKHYTSLNSFINLNESDFEGRFFLSSEADYFGFDSITVDTQK